MKTENAKQPEATAPATTAPHKITPKNFLSWLVVVVLLLLALAASLVLKHKYGYNPKTEPKTEQQSAQQNPQEQQTDNNINKVISSYKYYYTEDDKYRYEYDESQPDADWKTDGKITRTEKITGETKTMIESVRETNKVEDGVNLKVVVDSGHHPYLYFQREFIEGADDLIRYDGNTNKFTKLKISDQMRSDGSNAMPGFPYAISIIDPGKSPDQNSDRSVYLLDFDADTSRLLGTLPANETFNVCGLEGCEGDMGINTRWLDNNNVQINAYSTTPGKDKDGNQRATLVERKVFNINQ